MYYYTCNKNYNSPKFTWHIQIATRSGASPLTHQVGYLTAAHRSKEFVSCLERGGRSGENMVIMKNVGIIVMICLWDILWYSITFFWWLWLIMNINSNIIIILITIIIIIIMITTIVIITISSNDSIIFFCRCRRLEVTWSWWWLCDYDKRWWVCSPRSSNGCWEWYKTHSKHGFDPHWWVAIACFAMRCAL